MILDILATLDTTVPEKCSGPDKELQPNDVVLGCLSGRALNLWAYIDEQWKTLLLKKADILEARAVAIRTQAETDVSVARKMITDFHRFALRLEGLNDLFRLELSEQFEVELDWCVGVRKGLRVVKYQGPPADQGMTILESIQGSY